MKGEFEWMVMATYLPYHSTTFQQVQGDDTGVISTDTYGSRKYKLPNQQNGQVYLTSHRICYVDKADPRKQSVALDLKDVESYEYYVRSIMLSLRMSHKTTRTNGH